MIHADITYKDRYTPWVTADSLTDLFLFDSDSRTNDLIYIAHERLYGYSTRLPLTEEFKKLLDGILVYPAMSNNILIRVTPLKILTVQYQFILGSYHVVQLTAEQYNQLMDLMKS